jgi:HEPN domain-containing protein
MERSKDWIAQAKSDLAHARSDLKENFYDWACFSAQQAAEKAAKAVIIKLGAEVWGHSVYDLMGHIEKKHKLEPELKTAALELDKAYIPARYPDAHPSGYPAGRYAESEARRMIEDAGKIVRFCEDILS